MKMKIVCFFFLSQTSTFDAFRSQNYTPPPPPPAVITTTTPSSLLVFQIQN